MRAQEILLKYIEEKNGYLGDIEKKAKAFIKKYKSCLYSSNKYEIKKKQEVRQIIDRINKEQSNYYIILRGVSEIFFQQNNKPLNTDCFTSYQKRENILIVLIIYKKKLEKNDGSLLFRILHEFAHFYLLDYKKYGENKNIIIEYVASYFAAALIFNEKRFKNALKSYRYDIESIRKEYHHKNMRISYETVAHRCASLSNGEIHFLKTDKKGHIVKRFMVPTPENKKNNAGINICYRWCALKAFREKEYTQKTIFKNIKDGKDVIYYCYSKLIKNDDKEYTITIGCTEDFKENMSQFDDNRNIEKETFHCFVETKECNQECIN